MGKVFAERTGEPTAEKTRQKKTPAKNAKIRESRNFSFLLSRFFAFFAGKILQLIAPIERITYSHSIVLGGFEEMSYTTRFTPRTSLVMRDETRARKS